MAIAWDTATENNGTSTTSLSVSHTCSGDDRVLVVGVGIGLNVNTDEVSGITANGRAMTRINSARQLNIRSELWVLVAPDTGSNTIDISLTGSGVSTIHAWARCGTGAQQQGPHRAGVAAQNATVLATATTDSDTDESVICQVTRRDGTLTAGSGVTDFISESVAGGPSIESHGGTKAGASPTVTVDWDLDDSNRWAIVIASFRPVMELAGSAAGAASTAGTLAVDHGLAGAAAGAASTAGAASLDPMAVAGAAAGAASTQANLTVGADYSTEDVSFGTNVQYLAISSSKEAASTRSAIAYADSAPDVFLRTSDDEGATWASPITVDGAPGTIDGGVAVCCRNDDDTLVVWGTGATLNARRVVGSTPGTLRTSAIAMLDISGISACLIGDDILVLASATLSDGSQVLYATYFDWSADAWASAAAVREVARGDVGMAVAYSAPFCDSAGGQVVATVLEDYSGTGGFDRTLEIRLPPGAAASSERWSQPRPVIDSTSLLGVAVAADPVRGGFFFSRADMVWRSRPVDDLTIDQAEIMSCEMSLEPFNGRLMLRVADPLGTYHSTYVKEVTHPLSIGGQVEVSLGYKTASGNRSSTFPYFWIERLETVVEDNRRLLLIEAYDIHKALELWHPRDAAEYRASRSVFQIIDLIAARAGVDYTTSSNSANLTALLPDWFNNTAFVQWVIRTRPPGWQKVFFKDPTRPSTGTPPRGMRPERGIKWDVLERLLSPPVLLQMEASSNGLLALQRALFTVRDVSYGDDESLATKDLDSAEASEYTYGPGANEHLVRRARYIRTRQEFNHVVTWGGTDFTRKRSVPDWTDLEETGVEVLATVRDMAADTDDKADDRADAILRAAAVGRREDLIEIMPNVGQELWDVVTVTESNFGDIEAEDRRVTALRVVYDVTDQGRYLMWLTLGDV